MEKPKKPSDPIPCRVLMAFVVDGVAYAPDDLVEFAPDVVSAYADLIDPHPDAADYCRTVLGKPLIVHPVPGAIDD